MFKDHFYLQDFKDIGNERELIYSKYNFDDGKLAQQFKIPNFPKEYSSKNLKVISKDESILTYYRGFYTNSTIHVAKHNKDGELVFNKKLLEYDYLSDTESCKCIYLLIQISFNSKWKSKWILHFCIN